MSTLHLSNQRVDDSRAHSEGERRAIVSVLIDALGIRYLRIFGVEVSENIQIRVAWIVVCILLKPLWKGISCHGAKAQHDEEK